MISESTINGAEGETKELTELAASEIQGAENTGLTVSGAQLELTMGEIERVMANMMSVLKDKNATADALHKRFSRRTDMPVDHCIPFSSDRKYSGVAFKDRRNLSDGRCPVPFPGWK